MAASPVAALLRGNTTIADLNLRGNLITDEGARALGAVLGGRSSLRTLDMRGNRVGKQGIRAIAEALERSERVRHVYVHAGGKVEALGTGRWAVPRDTTAADFARSQRDILLSEQPLLHTGSTRAQLLDDIVRIPHFEAELAGASARDGERQMNLVLPHINH